MMTPFLRTRDAISYNSIIINKLKVPSTIALKVRKIGATYVSYWLQSYYEWSGITSKFTHACAMSRGNSADFFIWNYSPKRIKTQMCDYTISTTSTYVKTHAFYSWIATLYSVTILTNFIFACNSKKGFMLVILLIHAKLSLQNVSVSAIFHDDVNV